MIRVFKSKLLNKKMNRRREREAGKVTRVAVEGMDELALSMCKNFVDKFILYHFDEGKVGCFGVVNGMIKVDDVFISGGELVIIGKMSGLPIRNEIRLRRGMLWGVIVAKKQIIFRSDMGFQILTFKLLSEVKKMGD